MADVIFTEKKVFKKDIFPTIIQIMTSAGWSNVSSNEATDFWVMKSSGERGDQELCIQLRPTSASAANDITTTDYNVMSYRLCGGYTPSQIANTAGVFERTVAQEAFKALYTAPTTNVINKENECTLFYHANKDRLILIIEMQPSLGYQPITHFIGLPVSFVTETKSRGLIVGSSSYANTAGQFHISNSAEPLPIETAAQTRPFQCTLAPKSPNSAGIQTPVECYYGNTTEGMRGKIDGLYFLPANAMSNGDTSTAGTSVFRCVNNGVASSNAFPSATMVFQIQ